MFTHNATHANHVGHTNNARHATHSPYIKFSSFKLPDLWNVCFLVFVGDTQDVCQNLNFKGEGSGCQLPSVQLHFAYSVSQTSLNLYLANQVGG